MALQTLWSDYIIRFLQALVDCFVYLLRLFNPQFSIKVSGFELSYNYDMGVHNDDGDRGDGIPARQLSAEKVHQWFVLQCIDVDLLRIAHLYAGSIHSIWEITILGYKWSTKRSLSPQERLRQMHSGTESGAHHQDVTTQRFFDLRIINLLVAVVFLACSAIYWEHLIPHVVRTLLPVLLQPMGQISILSFMISYRTLVAWTQLQIAVLNVFINRGSKAGWRDYLYPFVHPRLILFALIVPAVISGFYPAVFLLCITGLISLYDILNAQQSLFMFHLPACFLYINVGCDLREAHQTFNAACVDFALFKLDGGIMNGIRGSKSQFNPDLVRSLS